MKLIKQVFVGFLGLAVLLFLLSLPLPSRINISKSVLVNKPAPIVATALKNIQDWKEWNPLLQDSGARYQYDGISKVSWRAKDGKLNQIELKPYTVDSIYALITTNNKQAFESGFSIVANTDGNEYTKVDWWIREDLGWYPWEKFYGLFSESLKESYLENTLQAFKRHLEQPQR